MLGAGKGIETGAAMTIQENAPQLTFATAKRRFGAYIIDVIIFSIFNFALKGALGPSFGFSRLNAVAQASTALYFILFESFAGATPGKMAVGLSVGDLKGKRLDPIRALLRYAILNIPAVPLLIFSFSPALGTMMDQVEKQKGNATGVQMLMTSPENIHTLILYLGTIVVAIVLNLALIGLPIIFTKEKTGLHDKLSQSRVFRNAS
jgi:uncharacterized RDD family membrane protein YckC